MELSFVVLSLRLILALLWLVAAVGKLRNPREFARSVQEYRLVSPSLANALGWGLPPLELLLGVALLLGIAPRWAAAATAALLLVFAFAMASALVRRLRIRCHCFGELGAVPISWISVARNLCLALAAGAVALEGTHHWSLLQLPAPHSVAVEPSVLTVVPVMLAMTGLLLASHLLVTLNSVYRVARGRRPDDLLRF
jgi:uncharacterized membrane protein YphA (DoxX/SURF4 family)